ncbi:hypothetical protein D6827_00365, partial [Candidatus Parcubacteria bacterium]
MPDTNTQGDNKEKETPTTSPVDNKPTDDQSVNASGGDTPSDGNSGEPMIPKHRLDEEASKRKALEEKL